VITTTPHPPFCVSRHAMPFLAFLTVDPLPQHHLNHDCFCRHRQRSPPPPIDASSFTYVSSSHASRCIHASLFSDGYYHLPLRTVASYNYSFTHEFLPRRRTSRYVFFHLGGFGHVFVIVRTLGEMTSTCFCMYRMLILNCGCGNTIKSPK